MNTAYQLGQTSDRKLQLIVASADFGARVAAYIASRPAIVYSGDSAEEAVGKLLFSKDSPFAGQGGEKSLITAGSNYSELGRAVLEKITLGNLEMEVIYQSIDQEM